MNLTFRNGFDSYEGGALSIWAGTVELHCTNFVENRSMYGGGAISQYGGSAEMTVIDSSFTSNYADYEGGAISFAGETGGQLSISGSLFNLNESGHEAGAIDVGVRGHDDVFIASTTFQSNTCDVEGGAIDFGTSGSGTLTVVGSTFVENTAGDGGAIAFGSWAERLQVWVEGTVLDGNTARGTGGALGVGSRISCIEAHFVDAEITSNSPTAVAMGANATTISVNTNWGDGIDDNEGDLSCPCGRFDSLGSQESFTCERDGTWR